MCEILYMTADQSPESHPNHAKLARKGDIISVKPDGWKWSQTLLDGGKQKKFAILKMPGVSVEKMQTYLDGVYEGDFVFINGEITYVELLSQLRRYKIPDTINSADLSTLTSELSTSTQKETLFASLIVDREAA